MNCLCAARRWGWFIAALASFGCGGSSGEPTGQSPSKIGAEVAYYGAYEGGGVDSAIADCVMRNGGKNIVGDPYDFGAGPFVTRLGGGVFQTYANRIGDVSACRHLEVTKVAWLVRGKIFIAYYGTYYTNGDWVQWTGSSALGYPVEDDHSGYVGIPILGRDHRPDVLGNFQQFQGGYITGDLDNPYGVYPGLPPDPFNDASCEGAPLTAADAAARIGSDNPLAPLGRFVVLRRTR